MFQKMSETKLAILLHQRSHVDADADRYLTGRNTVVANVITQAIVQFAEQPRRIYGNIAALVEPGRGPRGWGSSGFARLKRGNGRHPRQHQSHSGDEIGGAPFGQSHAVDRKSVVSGKSVSVRVDLGGRRIIKKKITQKSPQCT